MIKFCVPEGIDIGKVDFSSLNESTISGPGRNSVKVETELSLLHGSVKSLLTMSCTAALEMIALLLDIKVGDEIIMPSWTFSSTANAFALRGARIKFIDIELDSLNMNPKLVEAAINENTIAIVTINYAGIPGKLLELKKIAERKKIHLIEDNAHGFGGYLDQKPLGSFGSLSALSFHQTKNLQCGEGGALIINDRTYISRAEIIREKGTDRSSFFRGEIDKYTWRSLGSSFAPSEIISYYLRQNLSLFGIQQAKRSTIFKSYLSELKFWSSQNDVLMPKVDILDSPAFHIFWLIFPSESNSVSFLEKMSERGIQCSRHYAPLHSAPAAKLCSVSVNKELINTDFVGSNLVRLPLYSKLTDQDLEQIIAAVKEFKC